MKTLPESNEPVAWKDAMEVAFWRMYEHGKNNNPVSAQCEVQALWMLCDGEFDDITAWHPSQWKLPPQRQPLTDWEVEVWAKKPISRIALCRAIEAAHGIKGEA